MSIPLKEDFLQPTTFQDAINIIKFLTTSHKEEITKLRESHIKQTAIIKKLGENRKKELDFISNELLKYETNLSARTEIINKQLAEKDNIIQQQLKTIEDLNNRLKVQKDFIVPEIVIDSNSDSGVALENEDSAKIEVIKVETKATRKCSRRFGDPIGFLRRVDFSPMKYKASNRDNKKKEEKKTTLEVPVVNKRFFLRQFSNDRPSDDERVALEDSIFSKSSDPLIVSPKKMSDSMNNQLSGDESDDSEEIFDRVMTRCSIRRSVKVNPKYKKINRNKSKRLDQLKVNIVN
ncbi:uncharacterized protein ACR2FA_007009 [Aphomia sociella]